MQRAGPWARINPSRIAGRPHSANRGRGPQPEARPAALRPPPDCEAVFRGALAAGEDPPREAADLDEPDRAAGFAAALAVVVAADLPDDFTVVAAPAEPPVGDFAFGFEVDLELDFDAAADFDAAVLLRELDADGLALGGPTSSVQACNARCVCNASAAFTCRSSTADASASSAASSTIP